MASAHEVVIDLTNVLFSIHIEKRFRNILHSHMVAIGIYSQFFFRSMLTLVPINSTVPKDLDHPDTR